MHFLYSLSSPPQHAVVTLLPLETISTKPCRVLLTHPLPSPHPPEATTMVLHPLIKKGTAVRVQPASQSAGYEEEQLNPPTLGLYVSVTVIAAPLGESGLGDKAVWGQAGGCQGGWWWLKCGERGWRGGISASNAVFLLKPNRETFNTNKTHWAAELTSLPHRKPSSPSFFFHPLRQALKWTIVLFLPGTS